MSILCTNRTRRPGFAIAGSLAAIALVMTGLAATLSAHPWNTDCLPDLWVIERHRTDSGQTRAHILSGEDIYGAFLVHASTALSETGTDHSFEFLLGDFDGDAMQDIYVVQKTGTRSGRTEVHVLNGADFYRSFLMAGRVTALGDVGSGSAWQFQLADFDGDRILDLYAIEKKGSMSGQTEVHVLNGADRFRSFLLHAATTIAEIGDERSWVFLVNDFSGDGAPDIYALQRTDTWSGQTEVHILDGASWFRALLVHAAPTALAETGGRDDWWFSLADLDGDNVKDLYAVQKLDTVSGRTEVHVLNGADLFRAPLIHGARTPIRETGDDASWIFLATDCKGGTVPGQR
jgi:hypothetical protein